MAWNWKLSSQSLLVALALLVPGWCRLAHASPEVLDGEVQRVAGEMRAGAEGATLRLETGCDVHLTADTSIASRVTRVWLPTIGLTRAHVLELRRGSVLIDVRGTNTPVVVRTARRLSVATVEGTIAVGLDAAVALEGRTWIQKQGSWRTLNVGRRVMLDATGRWTTAKDVLPAPSVQVERRLLAAPSARANLGDCSWSEVPGAQAYTLTLYHMELNRELLRRSYRGREAPRDMLTMAPGHYQITVRATDKHGLPGAAGSVDVRVVGIGTPGTLIDDKGVVLLPPGAPLTLTHTSGLQMRLDDDRTWFPAVPSLMMRDDGRRDVHLQHPQSSDVVTIVARPRTLRANVQIGPRTALWPRDEVTIDVELVDGGDGGWARHVPVQIVAHLGLSALKLDWTRAGNLLSTKVPAAKDAGPWVLRVAVFDEEGEELGRDVLEIVHQTTAAAMLSRPRR